MRAGFRFGPGCLGHNKHESEESALAKNSKSCPRVQSEKSVCQSQSLTEHQRHLKEHKDAEILSSRTTYHLLKGWTSEASATCSASFLLGKPRPGCDLIADIHSDKRIKLGDNGKDGSLPSTPDFESISCNDAAKTYLIDKNKSCSGMSDGSQSCLELTFGSCSTCRSAVKETCVHKEPCGQEGEARKTDAAQMSSELFCERNEVDADELESFTCQRVRVYCRKINSSCARTCMSWPFSNRSRTLTAHAGATACPAEPIHPSARNSDSPINQNQSGSPSSRTKDTLPSTTTTRQVSHQNGEKQEQNGKCITAKRNGKRSDYMSSHSSDIKNTEFATHFMEAEESLASLLSNTATLSTPSQRGRKPGTDTVSSSSTPVNSTETDSSMSTPSPSELGLSDWETAATLSPTSSYLTQGGLSSLSNTPSSHPPLLFLLEKTKGVELADMHSASTSQTSSSPNRFIKAVQEPLFYCEETQMTLCGSSPRSSSVPTNYSESFHSCESSLLLPQDEQGSDKEMFIDRSPPILEPYHNTSPTSYISKELFVENNSNEFMLPPLLSPVTSPERDSCTSFLPQSQYSSDEEEEEEEKNKHTRSPGHYMPQISNGNHQSWEESPDHHQYEEPGNEELEGVSSKLKSPSSHGSVGDLSDAMEEESQDETDNKDDLEQGNGGSRQVPFDPKIKTNLTSGVLTEPRSSPSSDEGQQSARDEDDDPSEIVDSERDESKAEAAGGTQTNILDEFTAYEQDILLVDVVQDDPELFEKVPKKSLLKLGPTRVRPTAVVKTLLPRKDGASPAFKQREIRILICIWLEGRKFVHRDVSLLVMIDEDLFFILLPLTRCFKLNAAFSPPLNHQYCRQYFSESLSCGFKMCRFQHVPVEGDEKVRSKHNSSCHSLTAAMQTMNTLKTSPKYLVVLLFSVCQNEGEDNLIWSFLGRIGVSLMLRYYKTHQWAKGRRVVEVLSISKVSYSTLKGLFGNEDGASRCCLITVATELFLLSGSVEGALNTLRENKWFLSSCSWPCEPADLDSRSRVLMRLAEKTSHRDTLEVLCNLPGIKEPNDLVDISRYSPLFNSHLRVCVDRQILPVASDTVDFMLSQNVAVDHAVLQTLLQKLGKQNLWLRAREVFRHSLSVGYYPGVSAPPGFMALIVPWRLGEVELALAFEMFITVNATIILQLSETTTSCLSVTLKRTESAESEYLTAGSRLLSAACIPQPKLIVHYTAVNSSQEQVFTLDISSARRWLRHNHLWANEIWMH
uniref:Protein TOPAZ1 n=1 Tax=Seriola dumerili TaxID=41447 RepID=A0A3B4T6X0_SERDU